jgi:hypothetical protein
MNLPESVLWQFSIRTKALTKEQYDRLWYAIDELDFDGYLRKTKLENGDIRVTYNLKGLLNRTAANVIQSYLDKSKAYVTPIYDLVNLVTELPFTKDIERNSTKGWC